MQNITAQHRRGKFINEFKILNNIIFLKASAYVIRFELELDLYYIFNATCNYSVDSLD